MRKKWYEPKLNRGGKKLFLQAYILILMIRLGLYILPFQRLQSLILKAEGLKFVSMMVPDATVRAIALSVERSAKYSIGNPLCLAKALATVVLMSIYGFPYQINIGVAKGKSDNLEAHAWVESEGRVIVGYLPDLSRYVPMSSTGEGLII